MKPPFKVGKVYENRFGAYEVLEILGPTLRVQYQDGRVAVLSFASQVRILESMADEAGPGKRGPTQSKRGKTAPARGNGREREPLDGYWLWVTRPEFYLDDDGQDCPELDPEFEPDTEGWWTCDPRTREGDLVFLYRAKLKRDIGYLMRATSDAFDISDDYYAQIEGWTYGCEYEVLKKLPAPVTFQDLKKDALLRNWRAVKMQMQGKSFPITSEYWVRLNELVEEKNTGFGKAAQAAGERSLRNVYYEAEIEDALARDLGLLRGFGYDLKLYVEPLTGRSGRQFHCGGTGRIDLLCKEQKSGHLVVIELKNVAASGKTAVQIDAYVKWVKRHVARGTAVQGLVISRDTMAEFDLAVRANSALKSLDISQIGFG